MSRYSVLKQELQPLVSVIICCYSGEVFFEEAVQSVIAQTFQDFKLIFHDNGASERYAALISRVADGVGAEVIRSDVNRYGEGLRFDVLPLIETPYLSILHDDDLYLPEKLARAMTELSEAGADYLVTDRQYTDALGSPLAENYEEINTRPIVPEDFPYQLVADLFYRGLRFHFSTFVCKTSIAKLTLLGDPFLPRIADSLFAARLFMDRRLNGIVSPARLTHVRVHGGNDMLYGKFSLEQRGRELTLLSGSEYFIFYDLLYRCDDRQLGRLLGCYPGIDEPDGDRTSILLQAAVLLSTHGRSKKLMAALCIHQAFDRDPMIAMREFRRITSRDLNEFMGSLYQNYISDEVWSYRSFLFPVKEQEAGLPMTPPVPILADRKIQALQARLRAITSSNSWRVTSRVRHLAGVLVGRAGLSTGASAHLAEAASLYTVGDRINLSDPDSVRYLFGGFSYPEAWGRWTDETSAVIVVKVKSKPRMLVLKLFIHHIFSRDGEVPLLSVIANGRKLGLLQVSGGEELVLQIPVSTIAKEGLVQIELRPSFLKKTTDEPRVDARALGVGISAFSLDFT